MRTRRAVTIWGLLLDMTLVLGVGAAYATHRWSCWKYANGSINIYNGATGDYNAIFNEEARTDSNSWHNFTDINLTAVGSAGSTDHANCFSGNYGQNGWLGIAELQRVSGCTILQGRARLNNTYLVSYSRTNKEHVACQEVGHLWGLNHNRGSSTTCMNDTILTAPQPNSHDQSLVNSIY